MHPRSTSAPPTRLDSARRGLLGLYALNGILMASWLTRVPTMREILGLSAGQLGGRLMFFAVGSLIAVPVMAWVVGRRGPRLAMTAATIGMASCVLLLIACATFASAGLFPVAMAVFGASWGGSNVPANLECARIEQQMGRTVLPHFHAAYSLGAVSGAGIGAAASAMGVPIAVQVGVIGTALVASRVFAIARMLPEQDLLCAAVSQTPDSASAGKARRPLVGLLADRRILALGLVVFAGVVAEGTANDWMSLAVVDGFGVAESRGGSVFMVFLAAVCATRVVGSRLLDRYGRVRVLRASNLATVTGLVIFAFAPVLPLALLGVVCWGAGAALVTPIAIAAGSDDVRSAARRVSLATSISAALSLSVAPTIGAVAGIAGTRIAVLVIVVALGVCWLLAGHVAPGGKTHRGRSGHLSAALRGRWTGYLNRPQRLPAKAPVAVPTAAVPVVSFEVNALAVAR